MSVTAWQKLSGALDVWNGVFLKFFVDLLLGLLMTMSNTIKVMDIGIIISQWGIIEFCLSRHDENSGVQKMPAIDDIMLQFMIKFTEVLIKVEPCIMCSFPGLFGTKLTPFLLISTITIIFWAENFIFSLKIDNIYQASTQQVLFVDQNMPQKGNRPYQTHS